MLALQESLNVSRDELPLYSSTFAFRQLFRRGNAVTAGMLGNVHTRVCHADEVFHRKSMHRKAGHAEAAGNLMFLQHGIGCDPKSQTFGQNLRLLNSGFWHKDDELVSAVAGDDIRLPAFLLEQPAYSRQNQIPFQMS